MSVSALYRMEELILDLSILDVWWMTKLTVSVTGAWIMISNYLPGTEYIFTIDTTYLTWNSSRL